MELSLLSRLQQSQYGWHYCFTVLSPALLLSLAPLPVPVASELLQAAQWSVGWGIWAPGVSGLRSGNHSQQ